MLQSRDSLSLDSMIADRRLKSDELELQNQIALLREAEFNIATIQLTCVC
jgi:hypothetical protein